MRRWTLLWLAATSLIAQNASETGTWSRFATLRDARYDACAVRLGPGQVLITGGTGAAGALATAEVLNADGTVRPAAPMNTARERHTCTLLGDGRVLVTGGGPDTAEVYDSKADSWMQVGGNSVWRAGATATLLLDGRVLIAGGSTTVRSAAPPVSRIHKARPIPGAPVAAVEIFDPAANLLLLAGAELEIPRSGHAAALLADGRVAMIGGATGAGPLRSVEIVDPVAQTVVSGPPLNIARSGHSATLLEDGRVLAVGGNAGILETDTAELLDGAAKGWTTLPARLHTARAGHFALLVPGNGGVLLAGGSSAGQSLAATEVFQPADDSFQELGSLTAPRSGLAGAALGDGLVLAMGGASSGVPQSACGVLSLPALSFSAALYHPSETVRVSGSNFPANTTIPLILDQLQGSTVTSIQSRLLTPSVTTGGGTLVSNFGLVPVVVAAGGDGGKQFRVSVRATSTTSIVRTVPVKLATTISIPLPATQLEGGSATFPIEVQRFTLPGPVTGSLAATFGGITAVAAFDGSTTPSIATFTLPNLAPGPLPIVAAYSGDTLNDASRATATYSVVSKTPVLELTSSTLTPQVGVPFTLTAKVRLGGAVSNVPSITGGVTFTESGVSIGSLFPIPPIGGSASESNPTLVVSQSFTALSFAPLHFAASFGSDPVYRNAASTVVSPVQQKAQTALGLSVAPTSFLLPVKELNPTFQCGVPISLRGTLTFPPPIGLSNRAFSIQSGSADGSVRFVGSSTSGSLVPLADQPGRAVGDAPLTLPFNTTGLFANFTGDTFLQPSTSAILAIKMQPVPVSVQFVGLGSTATNPLTVTAAVTNNVSSACTVNGPEGTIQFFDGTNNLGIVSLPSNSLSPSQVLDGTSNTIIVSESGKQARLTISLPVGVHNLRAHYSGDAFHAPADSVVVAVTFQ